MSARPSASTIHGRKPRLPCEDCRSRVRAEDMRARSVAIASHACELSIDLPRRLAHAAPVEAARDRLAVDAERLVILHQLVAQGFDVADREIAVRRQLDIEVRPDV